MDGWVGIGWMVIRGCFGRWSAAVGGPRWSLPSSLAFPEYPSRRVGRAVLSGPVLPSRPEILRAVDKMRHGARTSRWLVRTHARERAARNFHFSKRIFEWSNAKWHLTTDRVIELYGSRYRSKERGTCGDFEIKQIVRRNFATGNAIGWNVTM